MSENEVQKKKIEFELRWMSSWPVELSWQDAVPTPDRPVRPIEPQFNFANPLQLFR
jgi:hypothetical protein